MSPRVNGENCPQCGFIYEQHKTSHLLELEPGTILKNRYFVGKMLGDGSFGITYLGFDSKLQVKIAIKEYFPRNLVVRSSFYNKIIRLTRFE